MEAVILAGGRGLRLRQLIKDVPKPMAKIGARPFLEHLVLWLVDSGIREITLSIGYKRGVIKRYFRNGARWGARIRYSEEDEPLGTGGAVKRAMKRAGEEPFLIMNGDSFCRTDLVRFSDFHRKKKAFLSMVLAKVKPSPDYGAVALDRHRRIRCFAEKAKEGDENLTNAGMYLMDNRIFAYAPNRNSFSLEYDVFPVVLGQRCCGFVVNGPFMDIGTPARYRRAGKMFKILSCCDIFQKDRR